MHNENRLAVDRKTAQELLGISASSFYKLVKRGFIHALPGLKNHKIYSLEEIRKFAAGQTAKEQN
jgi:hypothetical protein